MSPAITDAKSQQWSYLRITVHVVLVAVALVAAQIVATILVGIATAITDPTLDVEEWMARAESNGVVLIASTFASTLVCVPLVRFLVGRYEVEPWRFLRVQATSVKTIALWALVLVVFVAASDLITLSLGRPVVVDFMLDAYASAPPFMLFLALVIAAPLFEEIFFRGFLLGALESGGVRAPIGAVVSAALWAAIHAQYDLYGIGMIFLGGLLLAAARITTRSLVPCFVMHGLTNAIAFAETALVAAGVIG